MKIVIFGASGKTGLILVEQALHQGHEVTAYVRRAESIVMKHPKLRIITGNLSNLDKIKQAITGADACISTLGGNSLTKHAEEIKKGIGNIITMMKLENVSRFIYMSSIGAGESRYFMLPVVRFIVADIILRVPLHDHTINEQKLVQSELDWTVLRPGNLTDGPVSKSINSGYEKITLNGNPKISRENVATFILKQLTDKRYLKKAVWLYE